jgi:hypothetical protein
LAQGPHFKYSKLSVCGQSHSLGFRHLDIASALPFIRDFSLLVKPLTELTKKSNKFLWSDSCQQAFDKLKQAFLSPELMAYPRDTGDFILG